MNTQFEEKKLLKLLGSELVELFKKYNVFVAGGAITSIFTNSEINDIDVYTRNEDDLLGLIEELFDHCGNKVLSSTKKSTLFAEDDLLIQAIHFKCFETVEDVFDSFDFTSVMGAYDFKDNKFYFHDDFMKHNSQKIIKFNSNTVYPLISALRVQKYEGKGYKISKAEYLRIVMTCMKLDINSYEELQEHLGGMYGVNLDKLFEDVKDEEFNMETAIEKLAEITLSDEYFEKPEIELVFELDEVLSKISPKAIKYVEFKGKSYRVHSNGEIEHEHTKHENHTMLDIKDVFKDNMLYKFVKKNEDGTYGSYYDQEFIYKIGEMAEAKGEVGTYSCDKGKLHFNTKDKIKKSTYFDKKDKVLLEVMFNTDDLLDIDHSTKVTASKVYVVREVPENEWKEWLGIKEDSNVGAYCDSPLF
ncbi:hypothetical protein [Lysinibacillus sp. Bpr_S20]|uniref:hypothetical protein n=1 Tax=Lysinibacillus sp. Bpr_S20 TaxID=2933964 RepID=UPI002013128C|nr:hypothetical protein [Lysinibacillus sp. Bpr_S20]MCL1700729.1 hypothetical protein [Lysinibacillus sp. Bpr_S20]